MSAILRVVDLISSKLTNKTGHFFTGEYTEVRLAQVVAAG